MATNKPKTKKKVVLCIFDGFGIGKSNSNNPIFVARTPNLDNIIGNYPVSEIKTDGECVGLPDGQMGNSEIGHSTIGSGRICQQSITRINNTIKQNKLKSIEEIKHMVNYKSEIVHIIGLYSNGGVHSSASHLHALIKLLCKSNKQVVLHLFSDGRDTQINDFAEDIERLSKICSNLPVTIATICGRYYAMDRDNRKDRTKVAFELLVNGTGERLNIKTDDIKNGVQLNNISAAEIKFYIQSRYANGESDEFIKPIVLGGFDGINNKESILFFNFRPDRMRQMVNSMLNHRYTENQTNSNQSHPTIISANAGVAPIFSMVNYFIGHNTELYSKIRVIFKPEHITDSLGEVVSKHGIRQLRIAETEKYAHVTYFLNAGLENPFPLEDRKVVPSPKVETYDLMPQMSANNVAKELLEAMQSDEYGLIVVNFANCDMVGHTGNFNATVQAIECLDNILGEIESASIAYGWNTLLTADHGNAEELIDENGKIHTRHTLNKVYCALISKEYKLCHLQDGDLTDIAPTILQMLGLQIPPSMKKHSLIQKRGQ